MAIAKTEQKFLSNPSLAAAEEFQKIDVSTTECYKTSLQSVSTVLSCIEMLMKQEGANQIGEHRTTESEVSSKLANFFLGRIKTKPPPLHEYHGCFPHKATTFRRDQFICAKAHDTYILMIIEKWENKICTAYDPTNIAGGIRLEQLPEGTWTPLPTILPNLPHGRWEFPCGAPVLSLMVEPGKMSNWSCEFYKAVVVARPCDGIPEGQERGYLLNFGTEDNPMIARIPEQFVVAHPQVWQKA